jgi:hypothetical protein
MIKQKFKRVVRMVKRKKKKDEGKNKLKKK